MGEGREPIPAVVALAATVWIVVPRVVDTPAGVPRPGGGRRDRRNGAGWGMGEGLDVMGDPFGVVRLEDRSFKRL